MPDTRTEAPRTDPPGPSGTVLPFDVDTTDTAALGALIRGGDTAPQPFGLVHLGAPLPAYLAAIDADHERYQEMRPRSEVDGLDLAALTAWAAADAALTDAYDDAHDAPSLIVAAARADERAAVDAVKGGTKLAPPTRPAAEAKAIEAARKYRAALAIALDAIGAARDALRNEWRNGPWRARTVAAIATSQANALAARDAFASAMAQLQADRLALLAIDGTYGAPSFPGEALMVDPDDPRSRLNPPSWNGLTVAQMLRGQVGAMNRRALNPGSLDDAERFILADVVNVHYTPAVTEAATTAA